MYLSSLLTASYWFSLYTDPMSKMFFWLVIAVYFIVLLAAVWAGRKTITLGEQDKFLKLGWQKIATFGYSFGLVGLLLLFFRQQQIQIFGARLWSWTWWIIGLVWAIMIIKFFMTELPRMREERRRKQEFHKYL